MDRRSVATMVFATMCMHAVAADNAKKDNLSMDCAIAGEIGRRAYIRAFDSQMMEDRKSAVAHANAFWDIEQYSRHCRKIQRIADELTLKGLGIGAPKRVEKAESGGTSPTSANEEEAGEAEDQKEEAQPDRQQD